MHGRVVGHQSRGLLGLPLRPTQTLALIMNMFCRNPSERSRGSWRGGSLSPALPLPLYPPPSPCGTEALRTKVSPYTVYIHAMFIDETFLDFIGVTGTELIFFTLFQSSQNVSPCSRYHQAVHGCGAVTESWLGLLGDSVAALWLWIAWWCPLQSETLQVLWNKVKKMKIVFSSVPVMPMPSYIFRYMSCKFPWMSGYMP